MAWLGALCILAVVCGLVVMVNEHRQERSLPTDLSGNPVHVDASSTPAPQLLDAMDVRAGGPDRFRVPAVGLDVGLASLSEASGQITPPGFTEVYRVRNRGVSPDQAAEGTVYLVTHSVHGGKAPGNALIKGASGESALSSGTIIEVAEHRYRVTSSTDIPRSRLSTDAPTWTDAPGRLVVITCAQSEEGPGSDNVVITAALIG